jgi:hypothetical protein
MEVVPHYKDNAFRDSFSRFPACFRSASAYLACFYFQTIKKAGNLISRPLLTEIHYLS